MLDGRVKTLHPKVHGGILHIRDNAEHMASVGEHAIEPIDMVVVNLYAFEKTAQRPGVAFADVIENIDIGGPSMVRSAAKNFCGCGDRDLGGGLFVAGGGVGRELRQPEPGDALAAGEGGVCHHCGVRCGYCDGAREHRSPQPARRFFRRSSCRRRFA